MPGRIVIRVLLRNGAQPRLGPEVRGVEPADDAVGDVLGRHAEDHREHLIGRHIRVHRAVHVDVEVVHAVVRVE